MIMQDGAPMLGEVDAEGGGAGLRRVRGTTRVAACLGIAAAVSLAAGCSGSSGGLAQPLPSQSSSPSTTARPSNGASPNEQALARYRAFWSILPAVSAAPAAKRRAMLTPYVTDPELTSLLQAMRAADRKGTVFYGRDVPRPTVQSLSVPQKLAVVRDCQDSSHAGNEDRRTGRRLTVGVARHLVIATLNLGQDGKWRVASVSYEKTKC
jgi:hypothetical protein